MASQGGYDCEFVDGPPKELHSECSICLTVLRQPYLVDCCGHHFCKACLEGVSEVKKVCPLCNHDSFTAIPNKGLERVLNEKNVYCTNKKAGCEWSGELRQLDSHLNVNGEPLAVASLATSSGKNTSSPRQQVKVKLDVCQFVEVRCQNCPVMVKRSEMKKHIDECPNRPIQCKYCKSHTATTQDLVEKHQLVCPKFPVSCPNKCGASIQRKNVTKHVDTTCPLSKLQCEYSHVGCTVVMSRKKMDAHLKSASGMVEHLSLMDKAYSDLKKSKSEKKVEDEEKDELRIQVKGLESEVALMEESYQSQLASLGQRKVALEKEIRRQRNAIEQLTSENRNLTAKLDKYSSNYYDADLYYGGVGERPRHKSTRPSPAGTRDYGSLELDKPTRKSSGGRKNSADSDETDGMGWGTALSLAAGIGLGVVGAAGVAAMASQSSSDKDKKSKNNSWF